MKLISKEESIRILGRKKGFFGQNMTLDTVHVWYLDGIIEIDDDLASRNVEIKEQMTTYNIYPKGHELEVYTLPSSSKYRLGTKRFRVPIIPDSVIRYTIEKQDAVYEQQSKSVVGKAIIGGLLFGGAGAVVGGLTGLKGERVKVGFIDYLLTLFINYENKERIIVLGTANVLIKDVRKFFTKHYPNKYFDPNSIEVNQSQSFDNTDVPSVADELIKLKSLLDEGAISENEFNTLKKNIIK